MYLKRFCIILILLTLPLAACSRTFYQEQMNLAKKEKEKHPELKEFEGELEPPLPDVDKNNETILGIDSNNNGIRDDIEIWINRSFTNPILRMQAKKYAKAYYIEMKISQNGNVFELMDSSKRTKERIALEEAEKNIMESLGCMALTARDLGVKDPISSHLGEIIFNTKLREKVEQKIGQITSAINAPGISNDRSQCK